MNKQTLPPIVFHRVESFFLFAAMLLAILVEAACVYWLAPSTALALRPGETHALLVPWTAMTLPEYWLLGTVAVLLYRVAVMLHPPRVWGTSEAQRNRMAFLHLWRWAVALGSVQMAALYLDRIGSGAR